MKKFRDFMTEFRNFLSGDAVLIVIEAENIPKTKEEIDASDLIDA